MSFLRVTRNVIIIWFSLLVLTIITGWGGFALAAVAITGAMPFILAVFWLSLSERGKSFREMLNIWHIRTFFISFLFCYGLYGSRWASVTLNQLFNVDAGNFPLTYALLTVFFTPFGIFYRPELVGTALDLFNIAAALIIPYYIIYLLVSGSVENRGKKFIYVIAGTFLTVAALAMTYNISKNFLFGVKSFALWSDFNEHHLCTDTWVSGAESIVFLGGNNVLVYSPNQQGNKFSAETCDAQKKF